MNYIKKFEIREINSVLNASAEKINNILLEDQSMLINDESDIAENEDLLEEKYKIQYKLKRAVELIFKAMVHLEEVSD